MQVMVVMMQMQTVMMKQMKATILIDNDDGDNHNFEDMQDVDIVNHGILMFFEKNRKHVSEF